VTLTFTRLPNSPTSLGLLGEFVSRFSPFDDFEFRMMISTLMYQLETQNHVVAGLDDRMVGYLGWIKTTREKAEAWHNQDAQLLPAFENSDAIAVTVLTVERPAYILPLIKHAKTLSPGYSVYWKRHAPDGSLMAKRSVKKKA
jgi:hypothetical protein